MQQHVKYLVVEDESEWSNAISDELRSYFEDECVLYKARVRNDSAYDGDQALQRIKSTSFDLVTLDMNLGPGASKSKISGLDLLGDIADSNRAFFVIIVTGAVNDPNLERLYGREAAALMRYGAMNEAVKKLPAERVRILHKPDAKNIQNAMTELVPHLRSALDQYCAVSRERNIFRPFPGSDSLWEVRYNGGPRLTIPASETFELIRSALAQPNREMKIIQLVQSIAHSSGKAGAIRPVDAQKAVARRQAGDETGIDWEDTEQMGTPDHCPVDTIEGTITLEVLIGALLMARRQSLPLEPIMTRFRDEYGAGPLLRLPGKIREYARGPQKAEEEFQVEKAARALDELLLELGPGFRELREEMSASKSESGKRQETKDQPKAKTRVTTGRDTKEMILARKHWERAREYLLRHPLLSDFVTHVDKCVERGLTAKGHIHYVPTDGSEFAPFWLTE